MVHALRVSKFFHGSPNKKIQKNFIIDLKKRIIYFRFVKVTIYTNSYIEFWGSATSGKIYGISSLWGKLFRIFCTSIFKAYCFEFSIMMLWCLMWSTSIFSFFNYPIFFIFAPNFLTKNNQHLLPYSMVECLLEWVL